MPIDVTRLFASEFHAMASDAEWRAGFTLWLKSWQQVPAGSLASDDVALARIAEFGRDMKQWHKVKAVALHGWEECSDGRLYHHVVAEKVLEAWLSRLQQRRKSGSGNQKRWGAAFDPQQLEAEIDTASRLLFAINPTSKALQKTARRDSRKESPGDPTGIPTGTPTGNPKRIPELSQETGTVEREEPPIAPPSGSNGKSRRRKSPKTPWPEGFALDADLRAYFASHGMPGAVADAEFSKFEQHAKANGKTFSDWRAAARNWALNAESFRRERGGGVPTVPKAEKRDPRTLSTDEWRNLMDVYRNENRWFPVWGPEPGKPGCLVPAELLQTQEGPR
ncbi:MAG: hypothetical protein J0H17_13905 [Rhizobiales bacterium]|nr:hypothetical protein [Hyphomicrobiales bacterium]